MDGISIFELELLVVHLRFKCSYASYSRSNTEFLSMRSLSLSLSLAITGEDKMSEKIVTNPA